jgi:Plasmid encoded RepA protein
MSPENDDNPELAKKPAVPVQGSLTLWTRRPGRAVSAERIDDLIRAAEDIELQDAWGAKSVRFAGRCFVQVHLPHSIRNIDQFRPYQRESGNFFLEVKPDSQFGLPYGTIPRLILIWIADEVRRTKQQVLFLGDNLSKFMQELDIVPTGGRWGTVTSLKNQMLRLFTSQIMFRYHPADNAKGRLFAVQEYDLWWDKPADPKQSNLWRSQIKLTDPLFKELLEHSHPVDMRAIKALRRSPMELDVYCWLTYRMSHLDHPLFLSYKALEAQFGAAYSKPSDFRINLDKALWSVLKQYPKAKVQAGATEKGREGWRLLPSPTHIHKKPKELTSGQS